MGTVANTGRAALVGAALLLAAGLPARSQSAADAARCLSIEDTDSRVECLEGTQDSVETPPAPAAAPTAPAAAPLPISKQQSVGRVSPSFDCAKASTAVQRTICRDSTLAEWDSRMGQLFRQASALPGKSKTLAGEQRKWMAQRDSKCGSANATEARSCVLEMTEARLTGLAEVMAASRQNTVTARAEPDAPPEKKSETKRNQAIRAGEPSSPREREPVPTSECPKGRASKSGRGQPADCKVASAAKEREDFRRLLYEDSKVRPLAPETSEPQQHPDEIDEDTKLEAADRRLGYATISTDDLVRDSKDLARSQKKVALAGVYMQIGNTERFFSSRLTASLARNGQSTDPGIALLTDQAPDDLRAYFSGCTGFAENVDLGCPARIHGRVSICNRTGSEEAVCLVVDGGQKGP
jgi:uncharacterized protein